jgi:hypothetical protein
MKAKLYFTSLILMLFTTNLLFSQMYIGGSVNFNSGNGTNNANTNSNDSDLREATISLGYFNTKAAFGTKLMYSFDRTTRSTPTNTLVLINRDIRLFPYIKKYKGFGNYFYIWSEATIGFGRNSFRVEGNGAGSGELKKNYWGGGITGGLMLRINKHFFIESGIYGITYDRLYYKNEISGNHYADDLRMGFFRYLSPITVNYLF